MNWVINNCTFDKEIYFGGVDESNCIKLLGGVAYDISELWFEGLKYKTALTQFCRVEIRQLCC